MSDSKLARLQSLLNVSPSQRVAFAVLALQRWEYETSQSIKELLLKSPPAHKHANQLQSFYHHYYASPAGNVSISLSGAGRRPGLKRVLKALTEEGITRRLSTCSLSASDC